MAGRSVVPDLLLYIRRNVRLGLSNPALGATMIVVQARGLGRVRNQEGIALAF